MWLFSYLWNIDKYSDYQSSRKRHVCTNIFVHCGCFLIPSVVDIQLLPCLTDRVYPFNTLRPRQNGGHFADDIFKRISFNENVWISIKFSLKFVPKGPININPAMFRIMAWRRPGDKPLSEAMLVSLLTHICVTWYIVNMLYQCVRNYTHLKGVFDLGPSFGIPDSTRWNGTL